MPHPKRRWFRGLPFFLLTALLMAGTALAGAPATAADRPLVMAFTELAPWLTRDKPGGFGGAHTEVLRELARRVGRPLVIKDCPHKRCLRMLETGEADLAIGLQRSPEREAYLHFLRAPYRNAAADRVFYVRTGEAARISRYEDLYKLRVAVKAGAGYFDRFDEDTRIQRDAGPSNAVNLRKLMLRRVDAVIIPADQGAVTRKELGLELQVEPARFRVSDPTPRSVAVSRRAAQAMPELLPRLEQAMAAMRSDGALAAIYDKHFYKRYGVTSQQVPLD